MKATDLLLDLKKRFEGFSDERKAEKTAAEQREAELKAENAKLQGRIVTLEEFVRGRPSAISLPGVDAKRFSFAKALYAIASKDWRKAGYEKEVFEQAAKKRDASLVDEENLGNLVPAEVMEEIVPLLRTKWILDSLGIDIHENLTGSSVGMTRETQGGTGYWVGENTSVTASDLKSDMIHLRPHKAGALVKISNTLLRIGGPKVETFVRNSIAKTLARVIQRGVFQGTGTDGQPLGVFNITTLNAVSSIGTATVIALQSMLAEIEADDGDFGSMKWVMHSRAKNAIMKIAVGTTFANQPVFYPGNPALKEPATFLGHPYVTCNDLPYNSGGATCDILFGVMESIMLGLWGSMELMASKETSDAFQKDQTWVRALQECDVGNKQDASLCVGPGLSV